MPVISLSQICIADMALWYRVKTDILKCSQIYQKPIIKFSWSSFEIENLIIIIIHKDYLDASVFYIPL